MSPLRVAGVVTQPDQFVESIADRIKDRRLKRFTDAIRRGDLTTVKAMAEDSPDLIRCQTKEVAPVDYCPTIFAAAAGQREILEWMLDQGLAVDHLHNGSRTALTAAGSAGVAELLLARGAKVDAKVDHQDTALHMAAYRKQAAVVKVLLEHGADANARNDSGASPLHWVMLSFWKPADPQVVQNTIVIVDLLVDIGAQVTAKDRSGRTPLEYLGTNSPAIATHLQKLQHQNAQPR